MVEFYKEKQTKILNKLAIIINNDYICPYKLSSMRDIYSN